MLILDNGTTAMTGLQEHPGTGRSLGHAPAAKIDYEELARSVGIENVYTIDPLSERDRFEQVLRDSLSRNELTVIIGRRLCLLAAGKIKQYENANGTGQACEASPPESPSRPFSMVEAQGETDCVL